MLELQQQASGTKDISMHHCKLSTSLVKCMDQTGKYQKKAKDAWLQVLGAC